MYTVDTMYIIQYTLYNVDSDYEKVERILLSSSVVARVVVVAQEIASSGSDLVFCHGFYFCGEAYFARRIHIAVSPPYQASPFLQA